MVNDRQLLEIFLSEIRLIRLRQIEKTADNLYDPIEMPGTHLAFHDFVQSRKIKLEG